MSGQLASRTFGLVIKLQAEEPLVLTDGSAESMGHQTLEHVPGSMLLGAFATAWARGHKGIVPDDDPEFRSLFLDGNVSWGHGCPVVAGDSAVPVPLCWQRKKNGEGLPAPDEDAEKCRVANLLALEEGDDIDGLFKQAFNTQDEPKSKLKKLGQGFMGAESLRLNDTGRLWNMHVSVAEQRKARDGQLFGFSSVAPGAVFASDLLCADAASRDALKAFLAKVEHIHVGHARSAGYGRLRVVSVTAAEKGPQVLEAGENVLFLVSDYVPARSWESPRESLERELKALAGDKTSFVEDKFFCAYEELSGFNNMWRLPKRSVTTFVRGSVLVVDCPGRVELPSSLGGRQSEGFGRLLANPAFLKDKIVRPGAPKESAENAPVKASTALVEDGGPLLRAMRHRALSRQAEEAAVQFVSSPLINAFLDGAVEERDPSFSQLGNLRQLVATRPPADWARLFDKMLEKTPGEQWRNAESVCPFASTVVDHDRLKKRHDHISVIMSRLLKMEELKKLMTASPSLPGGACSRAEREAFDEQAARLALLALVNAWSKGRRIKEQGGENR